MVLVMVVDAPTFFVCLGPLLAQETLWMQWFLQNQTFYNDDNTVYITPSVRMWRRSSILPTMPKMYFLVFHKCLLAMIDNAD